MAKQPDGTFAEVVQASLAALKPVKPCAAGGTTTLGTGAVGDYFDHITIVPTSLSPGAVQFQDATGTVIDLFAGGANSVTTLHSWDLPLGDTADTGPWKVICGGNVKAVAHGVFTA
jgi:hypothetical protein